jgi:hypothetical protein
MLIPPIPKGDGSEREARRPAKADGSDREERRVACEMAPSSIPDVVAESLCASSIAKDRAGASECGCEYKEVYSNVEKSRQSAREEPKAILT